MSTAQEWIDRLSLQPHPEGGWYREVYRSGFQVTPQGEAAATDAVTSIHYLLQGEECSALHRIAYPELWYYHDGTAALEVYEVDEAGNRTARRLGKGPGELLSLAVEPKVWFGAEVVGKKGWALVSCAVAPGFRFEVFEMKGS
jgi:predicted cupin superfamily sugar epimerase